MIIHKISDTEELVYTDNRTIDFNSVISELKYSSGGGSLNSDVTPSYAFSYTPEGYGKSVVTTKLERGGKKTYILDNTISFNFSNVGNFLRELNYFGKKAVLNFKGNDFGGNFLTHKESSIRNSHGNIITFKKTTVKGNTKGIHNFIHRMKMDNGQMLIPIIKRYFNTILLLKSSKHRLTGYANLEDYLSFIRSPSKEILDGFSETLNDADFSIEINPNAPEIKLKAQGVRDDTLMVELFANGDLKTADTPDTSTPYIFLTTKPIKLLNQEFPYIISRQKNIPIFISPMLLTSKKMIENLKGGINLLK